VAFEKKFADGHQVAVREVLVRDYSGSWPAGGTNGLLRYEMYLITDNSQSTKVWTLERDLNCPMGSGQSGAIVLGTRCFVYDVMHREDMIAILYSVCASLRMDVVKIGAEKSGTNRSYQVATMDPQVPFTANPEIAWSSNGRILALRFPKSLIKAWPNALESRDYFLAYINLETGESEWTKCTFPFWFVGHDTFSAVDAKAGTLLESNTK
jgi:hypothetical protein